MSELPEFSMREIQKIQRVFIINDDLVNNLVQLNGYENALNTVYID